MRMNGEDEKFPTLASLETQLDAAVKSYAECEQRAREADRDLMAARSRVNECQKAIDTRLQEIRSKAPRDTGWHTDRIRGVAVEAPHG